MPLVRLTLDGELVGTNALSQQQHFSDSMRTFIPVRLEIASVHQAWPADLITSHVQDSDTVNRRATVHLVGLQSPMRTTAVAVTIATYSDCYSPRTCGWQLFVSLHVIGFRLGRFLSDFHQTPALPENVSLPHNEHHKSTSSTTAQQSAFKQTSSPRPTASV